MVDTLDFEGMPGHVLLETATSEEQDGMIALGMEQGMDESKDRLAELLTKAPLAA